MQLDALLRRARTLEERAAAIYRRFAAGSRNRPAVCALWTALAREEESHARALTDAAAHLDPPDGWRTYLDGWESALPETERCLAAAESLAAGGSTDRQLSAALDLESTELDALRHVLLATTGCSDAAPTDAAHATRLATAATELSDDPHVRMQAALLLARARLAHPHVQEQSPAS